MKALLIIPIVLFCHAAAAGDIDAPKWLEFLGEKYQAMQSSKPADRLADGRIVIIIPNSSAGEDRINAVFDRNVVVERGSRVVWINQDNITHNVRGMAANGDHLFYSGHLDTGESYEYTFNETGAFLFVCPMHPWQAGTVKVE